MFCSLLADYLLESIDDTVEPCEDFYQFSCGAWLENIRIPDDGNASILPLTMLETRVSFSQCDQHFSNPR